MRNSVIARVLIHPCLQAAAILSHLAPGTSLPEDRSFWPSYLSGGLLPPPSTANMVNSNPKASSAVNVPTTHSPANHYTSSSVPSSSPLPFTNTSTTVRARSGSVVTSVSVASSGPGSGGPRPRMHDYKIPSGGSGGITQIRPGLLGLPNPTPSPGPTSSTPSSGVLTPYAHETSAGQSSVFMQRMASGTSPMAVPNAGKRGYADGHAYAYGGGGFVNYSGYRDQRPLSTSASSFGGAAGLGGPPSSFNAPSSFNGPSSISHSFDTGTGAWSLSSLPRSDVRSVSGSVSVISYEESRSRSGSRSDDEESNYEIDVDGAGAETGDGMEEYAGAGFASRSRTRTAGWQDGYGGRLGEGGVYGSIGTAAVKEEQEEEEWDGMEMEMEVSSRIALSLTVNNSHFASLALKAIMIIFFFFLGHQLGRRIHDHISVETKCFETKQQ